jgi:hypothetical protein
MTEAVAQNSNYLSSVSVRSSLLIRALVFAICILATDGLVDLGTNPYALMACTAIGIVLGVKLSQVGIKVTGVLIIAAVSYLSIDWLLYQSASLFSPKGSFLVFSVGEHLELCTIFILAGLVSTVFFLKFKHAGTFELLTLGGIIVYLLSPHRNYHLDSPKFIAQVAWQLGLSPQAALLVMGATVIGLLLILSAFIESSPNLKVAIEDKQVTRRIRLLHSAGALVVALICLVLGKAIYARYDIAQGLTTNGVGEASSEGESPLGFHSALGSTNQPAALVRLEGDYSQNPFTPMLYMREGALSKYNGTEIVIAGPGIDADAPTISPLDIFTGIEDPALINRKSVTQSVYLLADLKNAYGIDYPVAIKQLKNPDPNRFRTAFRVYSLAPTYKLEDLEFLKIGDPRWSKEIWNHYTEQHKDPRYKELALRLTANSPAPIQKARDLLAYLSANSIYTLTPKHETKAGEDPVAPYLFGDMRGYCVHFAHATVFMLRGLGIPSRIGTGFMTDLSQSKDGHILLRMSDRHAWAEIYIQGRGWVPFDIQPEQVESAAETQVDMKLLEDLMSKLDPGEEILPKEKDEESSPDQDQSSARLPLPSLTDLAVFFAILLALALGRKVYIKYAWLLPASDTKKATRAHRGAVIGLIDVGISRLRGETWSEYHARLREVLPGRPLDTAALVELAKYSATTKGINEVKIKNALEQHKQSLASIPRWRKAIGFLNPKSILGEI